MQTFFEYTHNDHDYDVIACRLVRTYTVNDYVQILFILVLKVISAVTVYKRVSLYTCRHVLAPEITSVIELANITLVLVTNKKED